jgi:hypothetical protein
MPHEAFFLMLMGLGLGGGARDPVARAGAGACRSREGQGGLLGEGLMTSRVVSVAYF